MSSNYFVKNEIANLGALNLGAGTGTAVFAPGRPADVQRVILVVTAAQATGPAVITVGVRNVDDSTSVTYGSFSVPATAINGVVYVDVSATDKDGETGADGSLVFKGYKPGGPIPVNPGQELFLTSDGGGDTGTAVAYVDYMDLGFNGSRVEDAVKVDFTPTGNA